MQGLGTEFRKFLFCETGGIPTEQWSVLSCSVFRGTIFLLEIGNPSVTVQKRNVLLLKNKLFGWGEKGARYINTAQ